MSANFAVGLFRRKKMKKRFHQKCNISISFEKAAQPKTKIDLQISWLDQHLNFWTINNNCERKKDADSSKWELNSFVNIFLLLLLVIEWLRWRVSFLFNYISFVIIPFVKFSRANLSLLWISSTKYIFFFLWKLPI